MKYPLQINIRGSANTRAKIAMILKEVAEKISPTTSGYSTTQTEHHRSGRVSTSEKEYEWRLKEEKPKVAPLIKQV